MLKIQQDEVTKEYLLYEPGEGILGTFKTARAARAELLKLTQARIEAKIAERKP